jgi:hypothetical protein
MLLLLLCGIIMVCWWCYGRESFVDLCLWLQSAPAIISLSLYGGERRLIISIWLPFSELSKVFPMCVERKSRA